jgi:hypothetical protein
MSFCCYFLNVRYQHAGNISCWIVARRVIIGKSEEDGEGEGMWLTVSKHFPCLFTNLWYIK